MANKNANLHKAKNSKNDEFYTQLTDIENELMHYKAHFKDKIVLCNCDDPTWSAFWKYFHLNFAELGLKKLISTHYDREEATYKMEYTGGDDNNIEVGVKTPLEGNEDFRNQECLDLLDESDIVVTNPPFSLFREYVAVLMEHEKKFLIIGNRNALTYKEIFPLIRNNELWLGNGFQNGNAYFNIPKNSDTSIYAKGVYDEETGLVKFRNCVWFTNMDLAKRHEKIILWKNYTPEEFPKYDNYDAINVSKVSDIPCDYDGVMGVPITFLDKYNPDQFEIVAFRKGDDGKDLVFTREEEIEFNSTFKKKKKEFNRTFVSLYDVDGRDDKKRRRQNQWEAYLCENNNQTEIEPIDYFYPLNQSIAGVMNAAYETFVNGKNVYKRILICQKGTN